MMNRKGFTLIEFIVGMAAGVSVALVAMFLWAPVDNWMFTQARRSGVTETETAVMRILREVRRVRSTNDISTFTSGQFSFTDIDSNSVSFSLSGTDLMRNSDVLARNVQALEFEYLDENSTSTAIKANIRVVRVTVELTSGGNTVRLRSAARIRNI